jgi:parallel beta-helix repeat protein
MNTAERKVALRLAILLAGLASMTLACGEDETEGAGGSAAAGGGGNGGGGGDGGDVPMVPIICEHTGAGTDYTVGPGQTYESLSEVGWSALEPGDSVRVFWREEPYRESVLLSRSGTAEQPIRFCGVGGPNGELPVLDGEGATPVDVSLWPKEEHTGAGMVHLYYDSGQSFDDDYPAHILIEGFEIRHAFQEYDASPAWYEGAAGIVLWRGKNITIRGNYIHDNSNGIFVTSTGAGHSLIEDLVVEANYFLNNGELPEADFRSHHSYIQGARTVYQYNRYGAVRPSSAAAALKDRGPGTVVRYNWITGGGVPIDLVEAQEHYEVVKDDPDYHTAHVYGNYVRGSDLWRMIHFGGEGGDGSARKGPLYVFHNTLHFDDNDEQWRTAVVGLAHSEGVVHLHNNVIFQDGGRSDGMGITILDVSGTAYLGKNWISSRWREGHEIDFIGEVVGTDQLIAGDDPTLLEDMHPASGSPVLGEAGDLPGGIVSPENEYVLHLESRTRSVQPATDLGAFEAP